MTEVHGLTRYDDSERLRGRDHFCYRMHHELLKYPVDCAISIFSLAWHYLRLDASTNRERLFRHRSFRQQLVGENSHACLRFVLLQRRPQVAFDSESRGHPTHN